MKNLIRLTILAGGVVLFGCSSGEGNKTSGGGFEAYTRSFVMEYVQVDGIRMQAAKGVDICLLEVGYDLKDKTYAYDSKTEAQKSRYDAWCRDFGDMTYNRTVISPGPQFPEHEYAANRWKTIELVSDKPFDAQHPAGKSLGDITCLYSATPLPYIQSGYERYYVVEDDLPDFYTSSYFYKVKYYEEPDKGSCLYPVIGLLTELTKDRLSLLGGHGFACVLLLHVTKSPDFPGEHRLTLTCTDTDGNVFSDTITVAFR